MQANQMSEGESGKINIYRGSEWKKCDLHIHAPDTKLAANFDGLSIDDKWEGFFNSLNNSKLSILGITDYFSIGGYQTVLDAKNEGKLSNIELILPNIELRLDCKNDKGEFINVHVLFADESKVPVQKIVNFLTRLEIFPTDEQGRVLHCTDEEIQQAGGYDKVAVERGKLEEALRGFAPVEDYLIIGVPGGYGGFRSSDGGRGSRIAVEIDKFSHAFFGTEKDRNFFLGDRDIIKNEPKPVLFCSDAHKNDDIGSKYSWIKADSTFEGVVQIIFEPEIRISLEPKYPVYLYPQIISVELVNIDNYKNNQSNELCPLFGLENPIAFSSNMTSIIGSRAAGKSILAETIGYVFNTHQVDNHDGSNEMPFIEFLANEFPETVVKVGYSLGDDIHEVERAVVDIKHQFYLAPFRVEYWRQGKIEEVAASQEKIAMYLDGMLTSPELEDLEQKIETNWEKLEEFRDLYISKFDLQFQVIKLGSDKKEIESYLAKLNNPECRAMLTEINGAKQKLEKISDFLGGIDRMVSALKNVSEELAYLEFPIQKDITELFLGEEGIKQKTDELYEFKEVGIAQRIKELNEIKTLILDSGAKKNIEKVKEDAEDKLLKYAQENKIKITQKEYQERNKRLTDINLTTKEYDAEMKKSEAAWKKHDDLSINMRGLINNWQIENHRLIAEFNKRFSAGVIVAVWDSPPNNIAGWIIDQFMGSNEYFVTRYAKEFRLKSPVKINNVSELISELCANSITVEDIIDLLANKKKPKLEISSTKIDTVEWFFKKEETKILREDLILRLKSNRNLGRKEIKYGGKTLGKQRMSFGERCGTMLEVILGSEEYPIILDQPEDHLDSSLLVSKIIPLVRERKKNRQIIICTHSANIAVLADSELINSLISNSGSHSEKGSLENLGTRKLICDILEGGKDALIKRSKRIYL